MKVGGEHSAIRARLRVENGFVKPIASIQRTYLCVGDLLCPFLVDFHGDAVFVAREHHLETCLPVFVSVRLMCIL